MNRYVLLCVFVLFAGAVLISGAVGHESDEWEDDDYMVERPARTVRTYTTRSYRRPYLRFVRRPVEEYDDDDDDSGSYEDDRMTYRRRRPHHSRRSYGYTRYSDRASDSDDYSSSGRDSEIGYSSGGRRGRLLGLF